MVPLLAAGGRLEVAIAAAAVGTLLGAVGAFVLLRGSFEPSFDLAEVKEITAAGKRRVPIVASLWTVQNADVFLLSRFVDNTDLGLYALAAKIGLVVTFFPQGFRVAMRPLRKSPVFKAVRTQYGRSIADGQILGYFVLVCISSILAMVLLGQLIIDLAPPEFADAAPLIPLDGRRPHDAVALAHDERSDRVALQAPLDVRRGDGPGCARIRGHLPAARAGDRDLRRARRDARRLQRPDHLLLPSQPARREPGRVPVLRDRQGPGGRGCDRRLCSTCCRSCRPRWRSWW